jgi:hypothetical protein
MAAPPLNAANTAPASGFVTIPAIGGTALEVPTRAIVISTAGNLAVVMADGSDNSATVIAVTAGQIYPFEVTKYATNNTAVALGLR